MKADETSVGDAMALLLYVGAARGEATPDQLDALRAALPPAMEAYGSTGDERPVRDAVASAMGDAWEPSGEWKRYLDAL